jgi:Sulfotransferase domain
MPKPKIFCIGFHKTGTKSLAVALRALGYTVTGPNGVYDPDISKHVYSMAFELVARFDAFQDNPWPIIYKELDEKYPGSRFVLSVRNSDYWIKSQVRHFGISETPMRKWIYGVGCPQGNEEIYVRRFEAHNQEVLGYFQHRPNDLLVINLADGDGWEKLCPFLDQEVPSVPFPHANSAEERESARVRTDG